MKKDLLVFCVNNNHCMMPSEFFWSYHRMMKPNGSFAVQGSASVKSSSINDGIYQALQLGAEWMFLMDVDQLFQVNTIPKLLESCKKYDAKIMSVQYQIGKMPYAHVAGWLKEIQYKGQTEYKFVNSKGDAWKGTYAPLGEGVVEVDWVGSGGLLIHKDVVEAIGWAPFRDVWNEQGGVRDLGHDVNFCLRAKEKGFKVYVDTDVVSAHGKFVYSDKLTAEAFHESGMMGKLMETVHKQTMEAGYWNTIWQTEHLKNKNRDENCAYGSTFQDVMEHVPENAFVADVGCGPGFLMDYLRRERKAICSGYDFSSEAIEIVKSKGLNGHVVDLRSYSPNGERATFDVVVSTHTVEHIKDDDKFLETLKALCKPEGKVVVATPWLEEVQGHFEHVRGYSDLELDKLMSEHFKEFKVSKNKRDYIAVGIV